MRSLSKILKPDEVVRKVNSFSSTVLPNNSSEQVERAVDTSEEILSKAKKEAQLIMTRAESAAIERLRHVESMIEEQEAEFGRLREEAATSGWESGRNDGYARGFEEGRQAGIESLQQAVAALESTLSEIKDAQQAILDETRSDLLKLSVAVAEKILCRELLKDEHFPASVLDSILPTLDSREITALRVSPATLKKWHQSENNPADIFRRELDLSIISDEGLEPGDVIVDTTWGYVDARLRTRWNRILEGIGLVEATADAADTK